jgi:hypothetical protein
MLLTWSFPRAAYRSCRAPLCTSSPLRRARRLAMPRPSSAPSHSLTPRYGAYAREHLHTAANARPPRLAVPLFSRPPAPSVNEQLAVTSRPVLCYCRGGRRDATQTPSSPTRRAASDGCRLSRRPRHHRRRPSASSPCRARRPLAEPRASRRWPGTAHRGLRHPGTLSATRR